MQVEWLTAAEEDLREIARRVALNFGYITAEQEPIAHRTQIARPATNVAGLFLLVAADLRSDAN